MIRTCCLILLLFISCLAVAAQSTTITYQGKLTDSGNPANGAYIMAFNLFTAETGGLQIGGTLVYGGTSGRPAIQVTDGIFSVALDFGAPTPPLDPLPRFDGSSRWIGIAVKKPGDADYTFLSPRQPVTSTPYAIKSSTAGSADSATNSLQLGGVAANQYVITNDTRLSDARNPISGSTNYIQNGTSTQAASNFNISGNGNLGGNLRVEGTNDATGTAIGSFSSTGRFDIDAPFVPGGRFTVLNNGNVGIGNSAPGAPLAFSPSTLGKKITLFSSAGDLGLGVFPSEFRIATDGTGTDISFGADNRTTGFVERMRIRGSGALALGGNDGQAGQVITSNGAGVAPQWKSPTNAAYQLTNMSLDASQLVTLTPVSTQIPGLTQTVNISGNAKLLVSFGFSAGSTACSFCDFSRMFSDITLDGNLQNKIFHSFPNGTETYLSGTWLLIVGPGSHTVEIKAYTDGNQTIAVGSTIGSPFKSNLIVQVIPQ